jgi:hypothetical protein
VSAANVNDHRMLDDVIDGVRPVRQPVGRPRKRPGKLHGDKGYDYRSCRKALARRRIKARIARKGIAAASAPFQGRFQRRPAPFAIGVGHLGATVRRADHGKAGGLMGDLTEMELAGQRAASAKKSPETDSEAGPELPVPSLHRALGDTADELIDPGLRELKNRTWIKAV